MYNYWFKRKTHRLKNHNYSSINSYFVTICLKDRGDFLGENIVKGIILNDYGRILVEKWKEITSHYKDIALDKFIVMPDHLHGIIHVIGRPKLIWNIERKYQLLPVVIGTFKAAVTRTINRLRDDNLFKWQKSFYDHIIRDKDDGLYEIRKYIDFNPLIHSRRK